MFKCVHGLAPDYLCDQVTLVSEINLYATRSSRSLDVLVPTVNKSVFKKSFSYNGAVVWNSIPNVIRKSEDLPSFKMKYRQFYFKA